MQLMKNCILPEKSGAANYNLTQQAVRDMERNSA
jgi:hypothetical protein